MVVSALVVDRIAEEEAGNTTTLIIRASMASNKCILNHTRLTCRSHPSTHTRITVAHTTQANTSPVELAWALLPICPAI